MSRGHKKLLPGGSEQLWGVGGRLDTLFLGAQLETEHLLLLSLEKPRASWQSTLCVPIPRTWDN